MASDVTDMPANDDAAAEIDRLRDEITDNGFGIARNIIAPAEIAQLRAFWLGEFSRDMHPTPIVWGPHLGEQNRVLFHRSDDCCMYRSYDFLWNPPIQDLTRDVGLRLSRMRNRIARVDLRAGEYFETDGYGVYITTSYYPPDAGWLAVHEDRADERRHWHFMLLLTFKGDDYVDGGLHIEDRHGRRIDVDSQVRAGDAVFFDGSRPHGVDVIRPATPDGLGRLQLFSIPTFMERPQDNDRMVESISLGRFAKAKLRPWKRRLFGASGGGYGRPIDQSGEQT